MSSELNNPPVLLKPFANSGDKNTIPELATGTQRASLDEGFPSITSTPLSQGGIPPERADFNGLGNMLSTQYFYLQNGGKFTFNQDVSDAIGGYPQNSILQYLDTNTGEFYQVRSLINNNTYNFNVTPSYIDGLKWEKIKVSPTRNIGEVIMSTIPMVDASLHLLDGALIAADGMYAEFVTYIAGLVSDYSDLFTTETAWQQSVTDYGVCGKFVYDSTNNTVRLPKITGFVEGTIDATFLGDLTEAGLPQHTHTGTTSESGNHRHSMPVTTGSTGWSGGGANNGTGYTDYAGNHTHSFTTNIASSSIYGRSSTVQPQSIKVLYYIVVANSTKTDIEVDIDEIVTDLNGKADTDLSNLSQTGQAVLDAKQDVATAVNYDNISNCITQIPQDIKLELNNGTLTLKAGSVITDPQGGTQRTTTEDKTGTFTTNGQYMVFADRATGALQFGPGNSITRIGSGSTLPADESTFSVFYNSTDRKIYRWNGSNWVVWGVAFPLGIITVSNSTITSIDQVFNGFGYMGNTIYMLPNVKGLLANGFNEDGSLKNYTWTNSSVKIKNLTSSEKDHKYITTNLVASIIGTIYDQISSNTQPTVPTTSFWYIPKDNLNAVVYDNGTVLIPYNETAIGRISLDSTGRVLSLTPKTAFHALDYNDSPTISGWSMPSSRYIDLTLGASGSTYTAPANGWFTVQKISDVSVGFIQMTNKINGLCVDWSFSGSKYYSSKINIPVKKGDDIICTYNLTGATTYFRFIYAEGENV